MPTRLRKITAGLFLLIALMPSSEYSFIRLDERRGVSKENYYHLSIRVNGRTIAPYYFSGSSKEADARNINAYLSRVQPLSGDFFFSSWVNIVSGNLLVSLLNREPIRRDTFGGRNSGLVADLILGLEPAELFLATNESSRSNSALTGYTSWVSKDVLEVVTYSPHASIKQLSGPLPSMRIQSRSLISSWHDNCIPIPRSYHPKLNTLIAKVFSPESLASQIYFGIQDSEVACLKIVGLPLSMGIRAFFLVFSVYLGAGSLLVALPTFLRVLALTLLGLLSLFLSLMFFG